MCAFQGDRNWGVGPHSSASQWVGVGVGALPWVPSLPPQWNKYLIISFDNSSLEGRPPPRVLGGSFLVRSFQRWQQRGLITTYPQPPGH